MIKKHNYKSTLILAVILSILMMTGCAENPSASGVEYLENGQYNEAIKQFEQAIEEDINAGDAYRGIGIARWEQEDFKGAREAFLNALDHGAGKTGVIYNFIGCCDMKLNEMSEAINYFNLALGDENNSDDLKQEIRYNIIVAYEQNGDLESAKVKLGEYVNDYPDDEDAKKEFDFWSTR